MSHGVSERHSIDLRDLERRLHKTISGEVRFDAGTRALYASDASNYRVVPPGVVFPRSADEVIATVALCREFGAPVAMRGGGTSIGGQATGNGVVIDTSRHLRRIIAIDPGRRQAIVEPGVILDDLKSAAAPHGLTFGPDPSTHNRCTIGGMIGNNACGAHSVQWGTTADNVDGLDVLLYDGTRLMVGRGSAEPAAAGRPGDIRPAPGVPRRRAESISGALARLTQGRLGLIRTSLPQLPRRSSGYLLDWLLPERGRQPARALVGTEGTCVTVLTATVQLVDPPQARVLLVLGYEDVFAAAEHAPAVLRYKPMTVEGIDDELVAAARARGGTGAGLPDGAGLLYVELGGESVADAKSRALAVAQEIGALSYAVITDQAEQRMLWRVREDAVGLAARLPTYLPGDPPSSSLALPGWEDAAVPPEHLGAYLRDFRALLAAHNLRGMIYGHFGEGCVHARMDFDLMTSDGRAAFRRFIEEAADLVIEHGGVYSGEHGDGQARAELYERLYGRKIVELFAAFKAIWDPSDGMNPGILIRPHRLDENLRDAAGKPAAARTRTTLALAADGRDLHQAVRRCVGVGACRSESGGVMCPSYRVTQDERHSTRGRARLLGEMLRGDVVTGSWRSHAVAEALDLCLACKGCSTDCPASVDMATYKAEFLFHHYRGRLRPRVHYSVGWLPTWLRLAGRMPRLANAVAQGRLTGALIKRAGGLPAERGMPVLARESFVRWYRRWRRHLEAATGVQVLLWPDTFMSYFTPAVGQAAVTVLADAGFTARLPDGPVCCGLTWISTGQLRKARRVVRSTLRTLEPVLEAGIPVVVLDPSCATALRSGIVELLPGDERVQRLASSVRTLSELLVELAPGWRPPRIGRQAVVQRHCHQYAVLGFDADRTLLEQAGVEADVLDEGCCGLAGDFGFTRGHYDVSMAIGELGVLPAVRGAAPDTLILADGASCRLQIEHGTDRQALHLAEVLASGLDQRLRPGSAFFDRR